MSTTKTVCLGDIGTVILLTVKDQDDIVVNLAAATKLRIHARSPSGATIEWTALVYTDGTDGKLYYTTVAGDWDEVGTWILQAYVEVGAFKGHSITKLQVKVLDTVT